MVSMGGVEILLERHQCHDGRAKVLTARCKKKEEEDKNRTVRIDYLVIVIVFRVWIIIAFHQLKTGRLQDT